jgi:multiple sugar transport system ATP-binding protein
MAQITLENLTKDFGRVVAVKELNLNCPDGEFLCLLGPSGCGKTTTLRMIAGLETPTQGAIYFDGKPVNQLSPRDRNIAMVFENYALYPHKTVYKNISYPLELRGMSKADMDQKVHKAADLLEIGDLLERYPKEISGGQKQRVATARALVREPAAFVMDEPLSHLDAKLRAYMRAELKRLQKELATTTILVTHDQLEAMTMGDKIAVMNLGALLQHGTPHELFTEPANVFVATFIGEPSMNLLPCEMQDEGDRTFLAGTGWKFPIAGILRAKAHEQLSGRQVSLGVRPQHMLVHKQGAVTPNERNLVPGKVYIAEPLGGEQLVRVRVGEQIVQLLTSDALRVDMDEPVQLEIPTERFLLFDSVTGKRVS